MSRTSSGMATITIHAPPVNFEMDTTISTTNVVNAPTPLMAMPRRQLGSLTRRWCSTMPVCDSVNEVNTPTT
jgi:hypothetical protein